MTAMTTTSARPTLRWVVGVTLAFGVLVSTVIVFAVTDRPAKLSAGEVDTYTSAMAEIASEWGSIEVLGMRPAVADLQRGEGLPPITIVTQSEAWRSSFDGLGRDLEVMEVPDGLAATHDLFVAALVRYDDAAREFGSAAGRAARGETFEVAAGIRAAKEGAELFDRAAQSLQEARVRAGLAHHPAFPSGVTGLHDRTDDR